MLLDEPPLLVPPALVPENELLAKVSPLLADSLLELDPGALELLEPLGPLVPPVTLAPPVALLAPELPCEPDWPQAANARPQSATVPSPQCRGVIGRHGGSRPLAKQASRRGISHPAGD